MSAAAYTPDEIARRGQDQYDRHLRSRVEADPANAGKMLALDVRSGDFEVADDSITALDGLKTRHPDAAAYIVRVGYPTAVKIGAGRRATAGAGGR